MIPESVVFKCTSNESQIYDMKGRDGFIYFGILCIFLIAAIGFPLTFYSTSHNPSMQPISAVDAIAFLIPTCAWWYGVYYCIKNIRWISKKYDGMADKSLAWNCDTKTFYYKDSKRSLTFTAKDIREWKTYTRTYKEIGWNEQIFDAFYWSQGEPIVLESIWNKDFHSFLVRNKKSLGLCEPLPVASQLSFYK